MYRFQRSKAWVHVKLPTLCILLCLLCLSSIVCSKNTTEPSFSPIIEPQGTSLLLQVVDAQGNPVPRAVISSQNALFSVDSSGHRLLENLSPGRFIARVDALGFASATSVLELHEGAHVGAQVKLLRRPAPIPFQAEQGGVVQTEQVRVSFPPNAVVNSLGQPVTGTVDVTIVPPDPTLEAPVEPGPPEGISSANGATIALESIFMAEVSLWHDGAPAQIAPGKSATLEFVLPQPLASNFKEGDSVPAAFFDLDAGLWREEGAGTIQPSLAQPGRQAWVASVQHFSWWNAYAGLPGVYGYSCANVLVLDSNGNPVPFMPVSVHAWDGWEYAWIGTIRFTGLDGRVCMMIKRGLENHVLVGSPTDPLVHQKQVGNAEKALCGTGPCVDVTVTIPPIICSPGAYAPCAYSGPPGTEGVGQCQASLKRCNTTGTAWSACQGEVLPSAEDCQTPFDDDCNGAVNEGIDCICPDHGSPCYAGPPATEGVGICHGGTVDCDMFGNVLCVGQQLPEAEMCTTPEDEDCDGVAAACPDGGTWSLTGSPNANRTDHTATLLPDGKVLVAAGHGVGHALESSEVYNPATGTWNATSYLNMERQNHSATLLQNGKILVAGHHDMGSFEFAEVYDPATDTWSYTDSLGWDRGNHTATLLPDGKVLVAGGSSSLAPSLAWAEVYDPASGTWSATSSLTAARAAHTATLLPNGKVLVAGGLGSGNSTLGTAELYDPASGTWSATGSLATTRWHHTATLLPDGKVLVAGGYNNMLGPLGTVEVYDPASGTWSATGSLVARRSEHTATLLPNGKVLVVGGYGAGSLATAEVYNPATGTWTPTGSLASYRQQHTATLLLDGKVLVVGGGITNTAEVYTAAP